MKRLLLLFTLAFVAMSCEEIQDLIDPKGHGLVFLEGEMKAYFDDKGDTKNYKFQADLAWSAEVSADWVEVNPTSGPAGENKIKIKVDKNKSDERRTGYVDITLSNDKSYRIELEQLASGENLDDVTPSTSIPNNEIWYTTTDGEVLTLNDNFNVVIVSNTYVDGKGVVKFNGDVVEIGAYSFAYCTTLSSIYIPAAIKTIEDSAFLGCENINAVHISDLAAWCDIDFMPSLPNVNWGTNPLCYGGGLYLKGELVADLVIPDGVTELKKMAFAGCGSITNVTIPDSVTTIGSWAFNYCVGLSSVDLGNNVATIDIKAFDACISLKEITIPDSVMSIGSQAFCYCTSLQSFNGKFASEDGMCLIVNGCLVGFAIGCENVEDYVIPDNVTTIDMYSIYYCHSMTSVVIPDSVNLIGEGAFKACSSLTSVTIGDGVTIIGGSAFRGCSSLTSVTIGDSVTSIGDYAFANCSSLTSITIPDSVKTIGYAAFAWCECLTSVYCKATTPSHMEAYVFWKDQPLTILNCIFYVPMESVEAYKSAEGWSSYADAIVGYDFDSNNTETDMAKPANNEIWYTSADGNIVEPCSDEDLDDVNILSVFGANIISNAYDAEKECWVIKFDGDVTTIGDWAFYDCSSLTSVTIPDSVTTIGYGAFAHCTSLTSVTIPDCVTELGRSAFACCYELTSATIGDSVTVIGMGAFAECDSLTNVNIPNSVTKIGESAFHECHSLTNVTIPDSVTVIEMGAFFWCTNITSVTISNSVTTIEMGAFSGCHNLQEFNGKFASEDGRCLIIDGVLNSFAIGCSATEYTIPDGVTSIGGWAFYECSNLTSVTIGDSVTTIGECAFAGCDSLTSITIPDSVTTIGDHVFQGCSSLTSVTIPDSVTTIGEYAFQGCSSLTSVTIPDSVTTIGERAFEYCSSLTSVTIPDGITTIGESAFEYCSSLKSVYCKAVTPPAGGSYMFYNNAYGRKIYVPTESVEVYKSASYWNSYADAIVGYDF